MSCTQGRQHCLTEEAWWWHAEQQPLINGSITSYNSASAFCCDVHEELGYWEEFRRYYGVNYSGRYRRIWREDIYPVFIIFVYGAFAQLETGGSAVDSGSGDP